MEWSLKNRLKIQVLYNWKCNNTGTSTDNEFRKSQDAFDRAKNRKRQRRKRQIS